MNSTVNKKIIRQLIFLAIILLLLTSLSGCLGTGNVRIANTWVYENEVGFRLELPEDWQMLAKDTQSTLFISEDGGTSLTVISELGGEAYYTLTEIIEMLITELPGGEYFQLERVLLDNNRELRLLYIGSDSDGVETYLDLYVTQPYAGIRFYLLFAGANARYGAENRQLNEIIRSFRVTASQQSLYHQMELRREAAMEAAAEEAAAETVEDAVEDAVEEAVEEIDQD